MKKQFICLANSRKNLGRCIAGKEIIDNNLGGWIRPVSERRNHEISEDDRKYEDGGSAQVFDIIDINFKEKASHPTQKENYIIDDQYYWGKAGQYTASLDDLIDNPISLWEDGHSSYNGLNDRVPIDSIIAPTQTLYFISLRKLTIFIKTEGLDDNRKKKVRILFTYGRSSYKIIVTDPEVEKICLPLEEGSYNLEGQYYITVSLGEELNGFYYKLAAGLFEVKK